jgi:hypothetical protein
MAIPIPVPAHYLARPRVGLSWGTATEIGETVTRWNFDRSVESHRTSGQEN